MPPIIANSKDGQGQKDKYLDTNRKILSQEMGVCPVVRRFTSPKVHLVIFEINQGSLVRRFTNPKLTKVH